MPHSDHDSGPMNGQQSSIPQLSTSSDQLRPRGPERLPSSRTHISNICCIGAGYVVSITVLSFEPSNRAKSPWFEAVSRY